MHWITKVAGRWETVLDQVFDRFASKEEPNWEVFLHNRLEDIFLPIWGAAGRIRPRPLSLLCKAVLVTLNIASYTVAASLLLLLINVVIVSPLALCLVALGWLVFGAQGITWGLMGTGCLVAASVLWHSRPHHEPQTSGLY